MKVHVSSVEGFLSRGVRRTLAARRCVGQVHPPPAVLRTGSAWTPSLQCSAYEWQLDRRTRHDAMTTMIGVRVVMLSLVSAGLRPLALPAADARDHCGQVRQALLALHSRFTQVTSTVSVATV